MNRDCNFYICPTCFNVSEKPDICHDHAMIHCNTIQPGDPRLKPLFDDDGDLKSSAPRWFMDSLKTLQS